MDLTELYPFGLTMLEAELQCQQEVLDHRNGSFRNLIIKVIKLASSQSPQLLGFLEEDKNSSENLVNFNLVDKRQVGIGSDKHPIFTLASSSAEEHPNGYTVLYYHSFLVLDFNLPPQRYGTPEQPQ